MTSWRSIIGPVLTLIVAGALLLADRTLFPVPNPGAISFLAVAFSAYLGGIGAGLVSAVISFGLAAVLFSLPGQPFHFTPDNFARLMVLIVCTPAIAIMMGILRARGQAAFEYVDTANRELQPLRSALDQSEVGVVLLDSNLHAQFINHAYRRIWGLPDAIADQKPAFIALLDHARDTKAYAVPEDKLNAYISDRVARVRAGDEAPVDLRLANGNVIRCRCKALADGGRMLTYGNVSDLVRSAEEMADLAMKDALTGIYNRRQFMSRFDSEWKRYLRYGRPLSLLVLDIDHFKSINDRFGHDVGDQVIIAAARCAARQTRESDVAARIGGEEFAILLPETELDEACVVAERLRTAIAEQPIAVGGQEIKVTVSIGTASALAKAPDPTGFMKRADEALYAAKRGGRDRVVCSRGAVAATSDSEAPAAA